MVQLSFTMMVKNESKYLERVLKSIDPIRKSISCEIIIVDTGSEDDTVNIAKKYTDKVYIHNWTNDFAEMRNISLDYASGEWVFILDGDEIIENPNSIIDFFKNNIQKDFNTAYIHIKNVTRESQDHTSYNTTIIPRLFRNTEDFKFVGSIHEQPNKKKPITLIEASLLHYGYLATDNMLMERKFKRNKELIENELTKDPENIYMLHQLFNTYSMYKDYRNALEVSLKAYKVAKKKRLDLRQHMYVYSDLTISYVLNNRQSDVENICLEVINLTKGGYPDFYYYLAKAQASLNKNNEAIENYLLFLRTLENFDNEVGRLDTTFVHFTMGLAEDAYVNLSLLYYLTESYEKVIELFHNINQPSYIKLVINVVISSYIHINKYQQLYEIVENFKSEKYNEIRPYIYSQLENIIFNVTKIEKKEIFQVFSNGDDTYSFLNKIRLLILDNNNKGSFEINNLDFSNLPNYFADILYYAMKRNIPLGDKLGNLKENQINSYFEYLISRYEDLSDILFEYITTYDTPENFYDVRFLKLLCRYILSINELTDHKYEIIFNIYLELGYQYMSEIYHLNVIENFYLQDIKNDEEAFFIYMMNAKKISEEDTLKYFYFIKEAIKQFPLVKRGIEMLVRRYQMEQQENSSDNMLSYKNKIIENIKLLIETSKLNEAIHIINEYVNINGIDLEIASLKGVTLLYLGDLKGAEEALLKGMHINNQNEDILFNLGYLNNMKKNYLMAQYYYHQVLQHTNDQHLIDEVKGLLIDIQNLVEIENFDDMPSLSLCIICFNAVEYTKRCVDSIRKYTKVPYKIHLLDNGSTDKTRDYLKSISNAEDIDVLLSNTNLGVPGGRNYLISNCKLNDYVVFFDNDIEVSEGWFFPFYEELNNDNSLGIIGVEGYDIKVIPPTRSLQKIEYGKADIITGYCMFTTRNLIEKVGLFDENLGLYWHDDDDYSVMSFYHGFSNKVIPASLIHHGSKSSATEPSMLSRTISQKNLEYLTEKWTDLGIINNDGRLTSQKFNILLEGTIFSSSSLSKVNQEIALKLIKKTVHSLYLKPLDSQQQSSLDITNHFSTHVIQDEPSNIDFHIRHQWPPNFNAPKKGKWVIIQPWEYGYIPKDWVVPMRDDVDEIWVPSNYNKKCFVDSGIPENKVYVIPNGVNTDLYKPDGEKMSLATNKKLKLGFVGGTIWRKGIDILLEAYINTFTNIDDVTLIIKDHGANSFYKGQTMSSYINELQQRPESPEIIYLNEDFSEDEMATLYRSIDCLVHPYRGEGFGMPITEAMACGKPVVVTNFGAALDFCDNENSFLIPARIGHFEDKFVGDIETVSNPYVAIADKEALSSILMDIYNLPRFTLEKKGEEARKRIVKDFTWDIAIDKIINRLKFLHEKTNKTFSKDDTEYKLNKKDTFVQKDKVEDRKQTLLNNYQVTIPENIKLGQNVLFYQNAIFNGQGNVIIGNDVEFGYQFSSHFYGFHELICAETLNSIISIGDKTSISNDVCIRALNKIEIGKKCLIGDRVTIYDSDFHEIDPHNRRRSPGKILPVKIGDNVWIGSQSMIMKGVTVGENSIIAAGSVVTKNVPSNCIVGGNPARIIRTGINK